ncbi:MAG: hypothetical protein AB8F74_01425 [Saprospiraceae bacterium]
MKLTIQDETLTGKMLHQLILEVESETITVQDLIRARVYAEVNTYNDKKLGIFNGLVQPEEAERVLNGYRLKTTRAIDPEKQYYIALDAFQKNGFFVLVDNYQVGNLEEQLIVSDETKVSFVRMTPLVGG